MSLWSFVNTIVNTNAKPVWLGANYTRKNSRPYTYQRLHSLISTDHLDSVRWISALNKFGAPIHCEKPTPQRNWGDYSSRSFKFGFATGSRFLGKTSLNLSCWELCWSKKIAFTRPMYEIISPVESRAAEASCTAKLNVNYERWNKIKNYLTCFVLFQYKLVI